ncbi:MAG TPA: ATP-binding protein [Anaerolineales bacterium]|jgi:signal transduction histidine kinase/CheY-like chemotaxis protein
MKNFLINVTGWSRALLEADYFRESAFIATSGLLLLSGWVWVAQSVSHEQISARYGLLIFALLAAAGWSVYRLYRSHYFQAVSVFLIAQLVFISLMMFLLHDLLVGYLFLFTVVIAGSLTGPIGALLAAALATALEFGVLNAFPGQIDSAGSLVTLIVLQFLAALISGQAAQGLFLAFEAAEVSARQAREHAEEAREHRGELHRTLRSLDTAYAQLQRVNAELLEAREIADAALNFKKEFAAQTSHELRTPLNLIVGFSETMAFSQNSYGVRLPPAYLRDVTEIHRNSRHLLTLIDDILDLSKLESGRMGLRFKLVHIKDLFEEVIETIQPLTQAKGLALVLNAPEFLPELWLDRARIHQVLLNILSNAARLTHRGRIELQVELREKSYELLIRVKDTGPGIPGEMLAQVFEEFQQVGGPATPTGTTGLGLAISKRIVELHGGRIWAESEEGLGSTFSFVLPMHKPLTSSTLDSGAASFKSQVAKPALVLLGEDGSDETKLLQRHLDGYLFANAPNWKNAQQLVENVGARAIITSDRGRDGFDPSGSAVPVITCPLPSSKGTAQALGISGYVRKPLTIRSVRSALKKAVPEAKNLLIVDDDPSALRLIERMVHGRSSAYQIARAYTAREAMTRIRAQVPDAILLDLDMPEGQGLALAEKLRGGRMTAHIPIIAISGREIDETIPDRPITVYSPKGFTPTEILKYLQAILSAVPPAKLERGTNVPPSPANRPV